MGASLHALAFFGGLFAYAHALPGMLDAAGIGYQAWLPETAYAACIALAGVAGCIVNHIYPDDEQPTGPDERRRRAGRKRIPRLLSGATTLSGLLASVQFPADNLPTWPIVVMGCFTGLYTLLHWQLRRQHATASASGPASSPAGQEPPAPAPQQLAEFRRRRADTRYDAARYVARTVRSGSGTESGRSAA